MTTKSWGRFGAWVFVGALGSGCDSEPPPREVPLAQVESEVIAVVCDQMFSCDCPNGRFYESKAQCEDTTRTLADQLRDVAGTENLTWDPSCLGRTLDVIDAAGCDAAFDVEQADACAPPCYYLHGTADVGEPCQISGSFASDCQQGLTCNGSTCVEPCADGPTGPGGDVGDSCDEGCKQGLYCDGIDFTCRTLPKKGQNCDSGQCEEGLFCESADPNDPTTQLLCKAPVGMGEACRGHNQCESGFCPAGFCEALPGEGDSCRGTFVCGPGLDCVEEVCVAGAPAVCEISVPLPGL
jgi:hypothetical protein